MTREFSHDVTAGTSLVWRLIKTQSVCSASAVNHGACHTSCYYSLLLARLLHVITRYYLLFTHYSLTKRNFFYSTSQPYFILAMLANLYWLYWLVAMALSLAKGSAGKGLTWRRLSHRAPCLQSLLPMSEPIAILASLSF